MIKLFLDYSRCNLMKKNKRKNNHEDDFYHFKFPPWEKDSLAVFMSMHGVINTLSCAPSLLAVFLHNAGSSKDAVFTSKRLCERRYSIPAKLPLFKNKSTSK